MFKLGDEVRAVRFPPTSRRPAGSPLPESLQAVGVITEVMDGMPYPFYLTSPEHLDAPEGKQKLNDLGPYCESELVAA